MSNNLSKILSCIRSYVRFSCSICTLQSPIYIYIYILWWAHTHVDPAWAFCTLGFRTSGYTCLWCGAICRELGASCEPTSSSHIPQLIWPYKLLTHYTADWAYRLLPHSTAHWTYRLLPHSTAYWLLPHSTAHWAYRFLPHSTVDMTLQAPPTLHSWLSQQAPPTRHTW